MNRKILLSLMFFSVSTQTHTMPLFLQTAFTWGTSFYNDHPTITNGIAFIVGASIVLFGIRKLAHHNADSATRDFRNDALRTVLGRIFNGNNPDDTAAAPADDNGSDADDEESSDDDGSRTAMNSPQQTETTYRPAMGDTPATEHQATGQTPHMIRVNLAEDGAGAAEGEEADSESVIGTGDDLSETGDLDAATGQDSKFPEVHFDNLRKTPNLFRFLKEQGKDLGIDFIKGLATDIQANSKKGYQITIDGKIIGAVVYHKNVKYPRIIDISFLTVQEGYETIVSREIKEHIKKEFPSAQYCRVSLKSVVSYRKPEQKAFYNRMEFHKLKNKPTSPYLYLPLL